MEVANLAPSEQFVERIEETRRLFPELDEDQIARLTAYCRWVWETNQKINLVSRKDAAHLYERHLWFSLAAVKFWRPRPGATAVDVGTGGGFPGIPLAIAFPKVAFTLLDSTRKKIERLDGMLKDLNILNVRTVWGRAEDHPEIYDYVWGRGVCAPPDFFRLTLPLSRRKKGSIAYLTGGSQEDLAAWRKFVRVDAHPLVSVVPTPFFETKFLLFLSSK
ncbi:MAG: 16S rRNA (guanine(527)-N(7))-methyltransferase RsmG [Bacteroidia bacterium]|nr:16S rRNA (guanine(527)-N(7))-methyltransferase RsmG [Bacteroidia bacterium]MDW8334335.1 16S rRNA (guanine(527)-N(7))-methyltransferase RsmG [Bacteroidia bacterium]